MATKTGIEKIDTVISEFIQEGKFFTGSMANDPPFLPVKALSDPKIADYQCSAANEAFLVFAKERGLDVMSTEAENKLNPINVPWQNVDHFNYSDRTIDGNPTHAAALIFVPNRRSKNKVIYMVDFTAAQYGYKEFPMVQKWDKDGWIRNWSKDKRLARNPRKRRKMRKLTKKRKNPTKKVQFVVTLRRGNNSEKIILRKDGLADLMRFGKLVRTFRPSPAQLKKIRAKKGTIHITSKQIRAKKKRRRRS